MSAVHIDVDHDELPDAGGGACCIGAAARGPGGCTCWEPVHDVEQAAPQAGPPAVRRARCADCAFRPDSPENRGDERYRDGATEALSNPDAVFYCHDGMRRRVALRHPAGVELPSDIPDAYDPPRASATPARADGRPALICAGFAAARRRRP